MPPGRAGDGFWRSRAAWRIGVGGALVTLGGFAAFAALATAAAAKTGRPALDMDFISVWAAARLAWEGTPLAAFDLARQAEVQGVAKAVNYWLYPPGYLLAVTPLGALPFLPAWGIFGVVSLLAAALAARAHAPQTPLWLAAAFAPAYLPVLINGQTSLLWAAGLMAALAALRRGQPLLAGAALGLLTLKPQLGITVPVALVAAGAWRSIGAAVLSALIVAGLPTLLYGAAYWPLLIEAGEAMLARVSHHIGGLHGVLSLYAALLMLGLGKAAAMALHWLGTALAALALWRIWRSPASFDLKAAALCLTVPLASPYLWHYETAILVPAALFMLRAGLRRWPWLGGSLAALFWLGGLPLMLVHLAWPGFEQRLVVLPAIALGLLWCLVQPRESAPP